MTQSPHSTAQKLVLVGGSGYLGRYLAQYFASQKWEVVIIARHEPNPLHGAQFVVWDGENLGEWTREIDGATAVVNLAGRSVNCRYNEANKRAIFDSRTHTTELVGQAIAAAKVAPTVWLNASTATIYRDARDRPMDENSGEIGTGFSVEVAQRWEAAFFGAPIDESQTRRVALRLAMTFGPGKGGVWEAFSSLVKMGFGGPMAGGKQFVSWLHIHDFARAVQFLIEHYELNGPVNLTAPKPISNAQFLSAIRRALKIPYALPTAQWQLQLGAFLKGTETELLLKSRWVVPAKLFEAGFKFDFPDWEAASRDIVQAEKY